MQFFTTVCQHMWFQGTSLCKRFLTNATFIWLFTTVSQHILYQQHKEEESFLRCWHFLLIVFFSFACRSVDQVFKIPLYCQLSLLCIYIKYSLYSAPLYSVFSTIMSKDLTANWRIVTQTEDKGPDAKMTMYAPLVRGLLYSFKTQYLLSIVIQQCYQV